MFRIVELHKNVSSTATLPGDNGHNKAEASSDAARKWRWMSEWGWERSAYEAGRSAFRSFDFPSIRSPGLGRENS